MLDQDLLVEPFKKGFRLSNSLNRSSLSVHDILSFPCNTYFLDRDSRMLAANELMMLGCGFDSIDDGLGKSASDISNSFYAEQVLSHDSWVMACEMMGVFDEEAVLDNGKIIKGLTFKLPLYGLDSNILGILGFTLIHDSQPMAENILMLQRMGLLNQYPMRFKENLTLCHDNAFFTKKQKEIIHYVVYGKSAKSIGKILEISHRTVEHHLEKIKQKLGVTSKSELIEKILAMDISN